ncbi:MAG: PTS sugar transporter subunit IIA [Candidatus Auribacter fodinae]|jgi:fructose-specific phosphotransferase system IIA component|uniref:PTS sugar transporter subunit IIA n=1 Tax=Candidatus Auribacter fodinae TaxID=2093366 RepID=A0A3A4QXX0_9BACT|nr:MAG: PTS sugar transporter subunit IIA [Candidatus Auribacter fodinae]
MKMSQLLSPQLIQIGIDGSSKETVIQSLIAILENNGLVSDPEQAFLDVMDRELQQSTGLEKGLAVPHGKSTAVKKLVGALAVSKEGIDYASLDGEPSHLFFILIAPPNMAGPHVMALANIAQLARSEAFRSKLAAASSPEDAYRIIKEAEMGD